MPKRDVELAMRWSDMDVNAHVNNVALLRYLEEARIRLMVDLYGEGIAAVPVLVAHQEIDYVRPLLYTLAPVRISMWATRVGRSGYTLAYEVYDAGGELCAQAESSLVAIDPREQRPTPLPDWVREALDGIRDEPVAFHRRVKGE